MKAICIIPARGGSKRLPGKNIKPLHGKPLLHYTIECAQSVSLFDRVIVSSDDPEILSVSAELDPELHQRDPDLAGDMDQVSDFLLHYIKEHRDPDGWYDFIALLLPTSPLRQPHDLRDSWELIESDPDVDGVMSVTECEHPPQWALREENDRLVPRWPGLVKRRQEIETLYRHDGTIMWIKTERMLEEGSYNYPMKPYFVPPERAIDIDTERDFRMAEFFMKEYFDGI